MAKHVVVIGAGLAGVSSAYMLCNAGYAVTVVDQKGSAAQGSSQQNGAQLSYAYCDALASPSLLSQLPRILLKKDPAFRLIILKMEKCCCIQPSMHATKMCRC